MRRSRRRATRRRFVARYVTGSWYNYTHRTMMLVFTYVTGYLMFLAMFGQALRIKILHDGDVPFAGWIAMFYIALLWPIVGFLILVGGLVIDEDDV